MKKIRLVVKRYTQQLGVNSNETFPVITRLDTTRALIALLTHKKLVVASIIYEANISSW